MKYSLFLNSPYKIIEEKLRLIEEDVVLHRLREKVSVSNADDHVHVYRMSPPPPLAWAGR